MSDPIRVGALRGIMMRGPGITETLPFYEDMWGLDLSHKGNDEVLLRGTGTEPFLYGLKDAPVYGIEYVHFSMPDRASMDALHAQVKAAGASVVGDPAPFPDFCGGYGFEVLDPDNRRLRFRTEAKELEPKDDWARPRKVSHVVLNTPDMEGVQDWYCKVLGFDLFEPKMLIPIGSDEPIYEGELLSESDYETLGNIGDMGRRLEGTGATPYRPGHPRRLAHELTRQLHEHGVASGVPHGRHLVEEDDAGCISGSQPLMDPYVWQPFMGVQYPGQDGFSFSMPIWAAPPLTIGGAITANIILELEIVGAPSPARGSGGGGGERRASWILPPGCCSLASPSALGSRRAWTSMNTRTRSKTRTECCWPAPPAVQVSRCCAGSCSTSAFVPAGASRATRWIVPSMPKRGTITSILCAWIARMYASSSVGCSLK